MACGEVGRHGLQAMPGAQGTDAPYLQNIDLHAESVSEQDLARRCAKHQPQHKGRFPGASIHCPLRLVCDTAALRRRARVMQPRWG